MWQLPYKQILRFSTVTQPYYPHSFFTVDNFHFFFWTAHFFHEPAIFQNFIRRYCRYQMISRYNGLLIFFQISVWMEGNMQICKKRANLRLWKSILKWRLKFVMKLYIWIKLKVKNPLHLVPYKRICFKYVYGKKIWKAWKNEWKNIIVAMKMQKYVKGKAWFHFQYLFICRKVWKIINQNLFMEFYAVL